MKAKCAVSLAVCNNFAIMIFLGEENSFLSHT